MSSEAKNILVLAGPSGGHLFPAWAFAESYRERSPDVSLYLVTGRRAEKFKLLQESGPFKEVVFLEDFPFPRKFSLKTFSFAWKLLRAFWQTRGLFKRWSPDLVAGFGSYISCPGIYLSHLRKIPVLMHEQNRVQGMATRYLAKYAKVLATSFDAGEMQTKTGVDCVLTGLPIRQALVSGASPREDKPEDIGSSDKLCFLIMGGSQGAHHLNELILEGFGQMTPEEKRKIAVIHITGERDYEWVKKTYEKLKIDHETYSFFDKMHQLFERVDFAITRAGANTLFELALFGIPAVVIPYPYAEAHQKENALYFADKEAVIYQDQDSWTSEIMTAQIREIIENPSKRKSYQSAVKQLAVPQAADNLVAVAQNLVG